MPTASAKRGKLSSGRNASTYNPVKLVIVGAVLNTLIVGK